MPYFSFSIQSFGLLTFSCCLICSGPLFSISVILSFPPGEMILSLCAWPDTLSTQGPVDLFFSCFFFFFLFPIKVSSHMVCNIKFAIPWLTFYQFEFFFFFFSCWYSNFLLGLPLQKLLNTQNCWTVGALGATLTSFLRPLLFLRLLLFLNGFHRIAFLSKAKMKD